MGIAIGAAAPTFTLQDLAGHDVSLNDFAGTWVVLYFYPKDDTPGCTTEACEFTSGLKGFERLKAKVIGVSPDSPASHRAFIDKYKLGVTLLSDPDHRVLEEYGAWGKKMSAGKETTGVIRSTVIIDPKGKIAYHWPTVTAKGHAEEVERKLAQLKNGE